MCELLIKASDNTNPDPTEDRVGCYKRGMIVEVFEDGTRAKGFSDCLPPKFTWILVPGIAAERARKYMEQQFSGQETYRRRRWQIRWADLPTQARNKLAAGLLTIKAGTYSGAYDYTWAQVKGYFRDLQTGLDETVDL